jgi:hypothetical protein
MLAEAESFVPNGDQPSVDSAEFENANLSFGDKPLIVLTRGNLEGAPGMPPTSVAPVEAAWKAGYDHLAALSTRGSARSFQILGTTFRSSSPGR